MFEKNLEVLQKVPVLQAILRLAIPSVLAMLVQVIYGLMKDSIKMNIIDNDKMF